MLHRCLKLNSTLSDAANSRRLRLKTVSLPSKYLTIFVEKFNLCGSAIRGQDNANAGRFISEDPLGFSGLDINIYNYVTNNPLNFNDPLGLMCSPVQQFLIEGAAGAAGGALSGAILGARTGNPLAGAAIGAVIGGTSAAVSQAVGGSSNSGVAGAIGAVAGGVSGGGNLGATVGGAIGGGIGGPAGGAIGGAAGSALSVNGKRFFRPDLARKRASIRGGAAGLLGGLLTNLVREGLESLCEDGNCNGTKN